MAMISNIRQTASYLMVLGTLLSSAAAPAALGARWDEIMWEAEAAFDKKDKSRYESLLKRAVSEAQRYGPNNIRLLISTSILGQFYLSIGKAPKARPMLERTQAIMEVRRLPDDQWMAYNLNALAQAYFGIEDYARAESMTRRALEIFSKQRPPQDEQVVGTREMLAKILRKEGRLTESQQEFEKLLKVATRANFWQRCRWRLKLAEIFVQQERWSQADALYSLLLAEAEENLPYDRRVMRDLLEKYADLLEQRGQAIKARSLYERAAKLRKRPSTAT